jgi:hypothetical protein
VAETCRSLVIPSVPSARSSRARPAYRPPSALNDLHILDVLELSESQGRAAAPLQVNQSTVSRSLQLMRREYRLTPGQRQQVCRHGHNPCVHYLRLAYREHRLMAGLLRIGSDVLHNTLLHGMPGVLQVRSLLEEAILHSSRSRGGQDLPLLHLPALGAKLQPTAGKPSASAPDRLWRPPRPSMQLQV